MWTSLSQREKLPQIKTNNDFSQPMKTLQLLTKSEPRSIFHHLCPGQGEHEKFQALNRQNHTSYSTSLAINISRPTT